MKRRDTIPVVLQPLHVRELLVLLILGGEGDAAETGNTGSFHDIDD
jgi:hypothetical protein